MRRLLFWLLVATWLAPSLARAKWDEMVHTEQLLGQLNTTTTQLVATARSNEELSQRMIELTQANMKSSQTMESLTKRIVFLTYVLLALTLVQVVSLFWKSSRIKGSQPFDEESKPLPNKSDAGEA